MIKQRQKLKSEPRYKKLIKLSDSEDDENELFVLRKATPRQEKATVEKAVEEGDTLQSLAIRYSCTIEDLKRLNNIHKENEIFAKRTIRVPHHPISMALAGVHISGSSSPNAPSTSSQIDSEKLTNTLIETEVNQIIFNSNLSQKSVTVEEVSEDEQIHLLPQTTETVPKSRINFNGVDGDLNWKVLIGCVVVLIVVVPLIYVLYVAEHIEKYHHGS